MKFFTSNLPGDHKKTTLFPLPPESTSVEKTDTPDITFGGLGKTPTKAYILRFDPPPLLRVSFRVSFLLRALLCYLSRTPRLPPFSEEQRISVFLSFSYFWVLPESVSASSASPSSVEAPGLRKETTNPVVS